MALFSLTLDERNMFKVNDFSDECEKVFQKTSDKFHIIGKNGIIRPIKTNFRKNYSKKVLFDAHEGHQRFDIKNLACPFHKNKDRAETKIKNFKQIYYKELEGKPSN